MKNLILVLLLMSFGLGVAKADVNIKSCEDWDNDGRFGIVNHVLTPPTPKPTVIRGNVGTYQSCSSTASRTSQCKGNFCTCEDWDGDGRFGIVKHSNKKQSSRVLAGNIGTYYKCSSQKRRYRNTSARYYSCEDWDGDGRFGLVQHNLQEKSPRPSVIRGNYGNYYSCNGYKSSLNQCKGNSLCICADWDKDGRFGVVKYPGKKKRHNVIRGNVGTYAQCVSQAR